MSIMFKELNEAPRVVRQAIECCTPVSKDIAAVAAEKRLKRLILAGRGSSLNAGMGFKFFSDVLTNYVCAFEYPSVSTVFNVKRDLSDALYVIVSQSGAGPDTISFAKNAKASGAVTVAVTNDPDSALAKISDFVLDMKAGAENAVAATKTFTGELAALMTLAYALAGKALSPDIAAEGVKFALADEAPLPSIALFADKKAIVLSRGFTEPVAKEFALKLTETCYVFTFASSVQEFQHGPKALINLGTPVILLAPSGRFSDFYAKAAQDLKSLGAYLIAFTDLNSVAEIADFTVKMPAVTEEESILVYTVKIQQFVNALCERMGLSPDAPRNLNKITVTA